MGVKIPFRRELEFEYGAVAELSPLIRRVIAKNPSPFTLHGTGTYILGHGDVAVIDPGPADPQHIEAILAATEGERISHMLVTHTHTDHSPGCALLREHTDAPTYAFGPHGSGIEDESVKLEESRRPRVRTVGARAPRRSDRGRRLVRRMRLHAGAHVEPHVLRAA